MENLNQFKKGLKDYKAMKLIECSFPNKLLNMKREIALVDTVQFALWTKRKEGDKKRSYMYYPKSSGYSFNSEKQTFTIKDDFGSFTYQLYK